MTDVHETLPERIVQLLTHLGIERAHFAACMPRDWQSLVATHPEMVASLSLICPMGIDVAALKQKQLPLLCIAGDSGRPGKETAREIGRLTHAKSLVLRNYFSPPWADPSLDRRDEIGNAIIEFISPDRKSTRLNSSHIQKSRMPSSA